MSSVSPSLSRRHLLLIHAGHAGGRTYAMVAAVRDGIANAGEDIELRVLPALEAGVDDLLWASGLLIGTPEHFGYMAGALKDFSTARSIRRRAASKVCRTQCLSAPATTAPAP